MSIIPKNRLEAFSDGVIAIIITIMVLELRPPHEATPFALKPLLPVFLSYVLSFVYLAIYWNNHHHLLHAAKNINAKIMWANMHLLFWLSLFPFGTAWVGESHGMTWPVACYGFIFLMAASSYYILQLCILEIQGKNSELAQAFGRDWKGKISLVCYLLAILVAFWKPWISNLIYAAVALVWVVPDRRIEKSMRG